MRIRLSNTNGFVDENWVAFKGLATLLMPKVPKLPGERCCVLGSDLLAQVQRLPVKSLLSQPMELIKRDIPGGVGVRLRRVYRRLKSKPIVVQYERDLTRENGLTS